MTWLVWLALLAQEPEEKHILFVRDGKLRRLSLTEAKESASLAEAADLASPIAVHGKRAAWMSANGVVVVELETGATHVVDRIVGEGIPPSWSKDGKLVFSDGKNVKVLEGTDLRVLQPGRDPAWSPNGRKIAYAATDAFAVCDADGRNPKTWAFDRTPRQLRWSPDGKRILALGGPLLCLNLGEQGPFVFDGEHKDILEAEWVDNDRIAYTIQVNDGWEMWIVDLSFTASRYAFSSEKIGGLRMSGDRRHLLYAKGPDLRVYDLTALREWGVGTGSWAAWEE